MKSDDQSRLLFSTAIIASALAYFQVWKDIGTVVGERPALYGLIVLSLSGGFSFLYLILTASKLMYNDSLRWPFFFRDADQKESVKWFRGELYDMSIVSFALGPLTIAGTFLSQYIFIDTKGRSEPFLPIIIFMTLLFISIAAGLASRLLVWFHKFDRFMTRKERSSLSILRVILVFTTLSLMITLIVTERITLSGLIFLTLSVLYLLAISEKDKRV